MVRSSVAERSFLTLEYEAEDRDEDKYNHIWSFGD